jgi:hypothetical protein
VDFPVVKAYPRGFAQELIAASRDSRDSYKPSYGRTSSIKVQSAITGHSSRLALLARVYERFVDAPIGERHSKTISHAARLWAGSV